MDSTPQPSQTANFGRYQLIRRVSVGGTAEIFKAKALGAAGFEKIVAVKRLLPHAEEDSDLVAHFEAEGSLVALLDHPLVARIYEVGRVGSCPYLAMEYVYGVDLQELTRLLAGPAPAAVVAAIGIQAAYALDYAHHLVDAAGRPCEIVHRDVSPQNFMLSSTGELKLIDFGIAKYAGREGKTRTGVLKGKHAYMSPEQVRRRALDGRSDIFSLGVILWELACGARLFRAESVLETLERVDRAEVAPPETVKPGLPPALSRVIMRCLEKDPARRPDRAAQVVTALEEVLRVLRPEAYDPHEAHPGLAQAMTVLQACYVEVVGDRATTEDDLTLDEYHQALKRAELGEDLQLLSRDPSDITLVPDTTDLVEYVARLRARIPAMSGDEAPEGASAGAPHSGPRGEPENT